MLAVLHRAPYLSRKSSDSYPRHRVLQKFGVPEEYSNQWLAGGPILRASLLIRLKSGGQGRTVRTLSFHSLRYSFNSAMANAGVSQEIRMKLTGHVSPEMNKGYTHHELEPLRAAVRAIPSIGL